MSSNSAQDRIHFYACSAATLLRLLFISVLDITVAEEFYQDGLACRYFKMYSCICN
jgi:hypothetical protein